MELVDRMVDYVLVDRKDCLVEKEFSARDTILKVNRLSEAIMDERIIDMSKVSATFV